MPYLIYMADAANAWQPVLPMRRMAALKTHTRCVEQPDGTLAIGGKRLALLGSRRDIDFPDIYLVPHAMAGMVLAPPVTWAHEVPLRIAAYCPAPLANADCNHRLTQLATAVDAQRAADIFVAPEAFLCVTKDGVAGPIPHGEVGAAWLRLEAISRAHPAMLIIPGSMIAGRPGGPLQAQNVTAALLNGAYMACGPRTRHIKKDNSPEAWMNLELEAGPLDWFDFSFRNLRVCLQICADSFGCPKPEFAIDVHIVVANKLGVRGKLMHEQGCYLCVDKAAGPLCQVAGVGAALAGEADGCTLYDVRVKSNHVPAALIHAALAPVAMPAPLSNLIADFL